MFGKVSSRWVMNVTVDTYMELTHDNILWHIYILAILNLYILLAGSYLFIYYLSMYFFSGPRRNGSWLLVRTNN